MGQGVRVQQGPGGAAERPARGSEGDDGCGVDGRDRRHGECHLVSYGFPLSAQLTQTRQLRPFLPALARLPKQWTLLYSLDQHGISLNTLYTRCQDFRGSVLFVVRDSGERVFGAWMGEGIHMSKGGYYGSGESFLWQMVGKDRLRVFKWTGRNDYVALCEPDYISFGGG